MARNLFEAFARAGQTGLGIASQNVIPMHQYNQRMARDEEERASMENWRQQQLAMQQQNAERDASTQRIGDYYGMMEAYLKNQKPQEQYIPKSINEGMAYGIATGNQGMISAFNPYWSQQNSVENRPTKEVEPKKPTNYVQKFRSRMADLNTAYAYQKTNDPENAKRYTDEDVFRTEFEGQAMSEGLNTDSIRTDIGLRPRNPRPMGNVQTSPGAVPMSEAPLPWDGQGTREEYQQYLRDWQAAYQRKHQ